jgi:type IV pilus assembly protein PilQ
MLHMLVSTAFAVQTEARTGEINSIIEGLRITQLGTYEVVLELRGTKMSYPVQIDDPSAAAVLDWSGIRFPRDTDKKDWWDEYGWSVLRIDLKKSDEWWQKYDLPLVQRIQVLSNDKNGLRMIVTGEKPLKIKKIYGMPGSDTLKIQLKAETPDIVPPQPKPPRPKVQGDPMGMYSPVTLELRDVSVREVFRMLADLRGLNLVLDASVPDTNMTFSFKKAKFSEVFAYILRMNNLTYSLMGNTLVVGTAESIGKTLGKNVTKGYKLAYGDTGKMPAIIMGLVPLPNPPVVDERLRTLYITATPEQHREIEALMNRIDHPGKQVMLEARLIEISDGAEQDIETMINAVYKGWLFSYSGANGLGTEYTYGNNKGGLTPNVIPSGTSTQGQFPIPGYNIGDIYNPVNLVDSTMKMLDAGLRAMETKNKGKVLANPSVVALDGQKSTIKLTHNYLYQSGVDDNGNPEFSEQETGPTLEITPSVGRDGFVTLKLKIANGEIVQFRKSGTSEAPETTNREVDTQIRVRDGELFVIGGLYQENKSKNVSRVPILGYIPLIGELFTSRSDSHTKSQMAFIVVPHILDVPTGATEVYAMPDASLIQ